MLKGGKIIDVIYISHTTSMYSFDKTYKCRELSPAGVDGEFYFEIVNNFGIIERVHSRKFYQEFRNIKEYRDIKLNELLS